MEEYSSKKRVRDEKAEFQFDSPEVKRIKEDLLENLDDGEIYAASYELDLFMKSFAEEIAPATKRPEAVIDLTSEPGELQPDMGYLMGDSNDELGQPSSGKETEESIDFGRIEAGLSEIDGGGFWGFSEEVYGFDSFEFGGFDSENYNSSDCVAVDGLSDYSDMAFRSSDSLWRPETLPAK